MARFELKDYSLTNHSEEDVSKTMYQDTMRRGKRAVDPVDSPHASVMPKQNGKSKVNRICDTFLAVLQRKASTNLQNIITSHVCKYPQDLDGGLSEIAKLQSKSTLKVVERCANVKQQTIPQKQRRRSSTSAFSPMSIVSTTTP